MLPGPMVNVRTHYKRSLFDCLRLITVKQTKRHKQQLGSLTIMAQTAPKLASRKIRC